MNTPWGKSDSKITLARGVSWVSTPSHGGFMISKRFANLYFSAAAVKRGQEYGGYLAYEEDCDATIILFETRAFDDQLGITRNMDAERLQGLSRWHADYLIERSITPDPEGLKFFNDNRLQDRMRAEKSPNLIVSASGDWKASVPKGWVEVITADGSKHLVLASEYDNRTNLNLLSNYPNAKKVA
jgi:hypothetical protein